MIKGKTFINKQFSYQIHATDRYNEDHGVIVVNTKLDEFNSEVTIYDSGIVIIESPQRKISFSVRDGSMKCE